MPSMQSQRSGYRSSSSLSPATIGAVLVVHLVLGAAILSMTQFSQVIRDPGILWTRNIPVDKPKPEPAKPRPHPESHKAPDRTVTLVQPRIDLPKQPPIDIIVPGLTPTTDNFTRGGGTTTTIDTGHLPETATPILVEAKPDRRYADLFQPAYPAAMLRLQMEGKVTVRVSIGPDGRVQDVTLISAPDPAFFEATRRQALSRWRFTPATRDGVPVASEKVMTVTFRITD